VAGVTLNLTTPEIELADMDLYLLSGNGSTKAWWADALPLFTKKNPIPLELPGFGDNMDTRYQSLDQLSDALLELTAPGREIFAVGINALVVLHALRKRPAHFKQTILLAPVGAFLWERPFATLMKKKMVRRPIYLLLKRFPRLFRRTFSSREWTPAQYARMGEGYRRCRAFEAYFDFTTPHDALDGFEWIESPIEIIWGTRDAVLGLGQLAAWDSILPRAQLTFREKDSWEHYPYIDDPAEFVAFMESFVPGPPAHSKAGRLQLGALAGLPVPTSHTVSHPDQAAALSLLLDPAKLYAVRSSGANEDKIDHSNAGVNHTYLRVPAAEVSARVRDLFATGLAEVAVQEFIEPKVSGVAFVRWIGAEVELVEGHLEALVSGTATPLRALLSKMGGGPTTVGWEERPELGEAMKASGFDLDRLHEFLKRCIRAFHYAHSDIEWAWDGRQFHLLQIRPVTAYDWRRCLTTANLDEILPKQVSRLMEHGQRRAAPAIPRIYALWDARVLQDNEPFSVPFQDASYINSDVFLSRFCDWGLPGELYAREIGGAAPELPFRLGRFLRSLPLFLTMMWVCRQKITGSGEQLASFAAELGRLRKLPEREEREEAIVAWFVRYYTFIVQTNMVINACISSSFGELFSKRSTVYADINPTDYPHRVQFESDPAAPRPSLDEKPLVPFPRWNGLIRLLNRLGFPGLNGKYYEVREWFRDSNMRVFHRLHIALQGSAWLEPHPGVRGKGGTFWQDGKASMQQGFSFMVYPGTVEGVVGADILVVDALEPGHYEAYKRARAVISRTGGRLSHGATLLRELRKPSAIIGGLAGELEGKRVRLVDGVCEVIDD
jgi:pimeloyl-ACP methyl ester carboxylesterase